MPVYQYKEPAKKTDWISIGVVFVSIAIFGLFIGAMFVLVDYDERQCLNYSVATGRLTKYYEDICYVQDVDNQWYSLKQFGNKRLP